MFIIIFVRFGVNKAEAARVVLTVDAAQPQFIICLNTFFRNSCDILRK